MFNYSGSQESEVWGRVLCPMPYAQGPMPYALCPMPYDHLMLLRKAIVNFYRHPNHRNKGTTK